MKKNGFIQMDSKIHIRFKFESNNFCGKTTEPDAWADRSQLYEKEMRDFIVEIFFLQLLCTLTSGQCMYDISLQTNEKKNFMNFTIKFLFGRNESMTLNLDLESQ